MEGQRQPVYAYWLAILRCREILLLNAQEEDAEIYDEVTEDQYKSVVKGRLAKDDFVIDDGVGDYVDNGMDDWGNGGDDAQDDSGDEIMHRSSTYM